jgi:hypothetical protein
MSEKGLNILGKNGFLVSFVIWTWNKFFFDGSNAAVSRKWDIRRGDAVDP